MKKTLNEQISRIKAMMNINEDDSQNMAILQQGTEQFNEMAEEDLTPDEFQEVVCANPDTMEAPEDASVEEKQKLEEFKGKLKTATIDELKQVKRQLKELRRQSKQPQQQNEQAGSMVTLLGVTIPHTFALVLGGIMLIMVLSTLLSFFHIKIKVIEVITSFCTGKQRTSHRIQFGIGRNR